MSSMVIIRSIISRQSAVGRCIGRLSVDSHFAVGRYILVNFRPIVCRQSADIHWSTVGQYISVNCLPMVSRESVDIKVNCQSIVCQQLVDTSVDSRLIVGSQSVDIFRSTVGDGRATFGRYIGRLSHRISNPYLLNFSSK